MTGPPDDPSDQPTGMAGYGAEGTQQQQVLEHEPEGAAEDGNPVTPDGVPEPWYRNRLLLALWALMLALLLTLVIYGIVELSRGGETSGPATTTSSTTSTSTRSSTSSTTTAPSTTTDTATSPETPAQTPEEAPPPANNSPSPAPPPRHRHRLHLPHFS